MKRYFRYFILLIISNQTIAQGTVKISGRIEHPVSDSVMISYNENRIAYYPTEYRTLLDKNGNFSLSFPAPENGYTLADLVNGRNVAELVLEPGYNLSITADAAHFDSTIQYKGQGGGIANFMARHKMARGRMNQYTIKAKTAINKEPADFLKDIASEKNAELDFLEKNKAGLPAPFLKFWAAFYEYYNYFFIEQYPQVHQLVKLRRYTDTIPEINFSVVKELPYKFNDSLLQLPPYLLYLTGVFESKLRAEGKYYPTGEIINSPEMQDSIRKLAYKMLPDKSAEYFTAQNIYGRARSQTPERNDSQLDTFKKYWPKSGYLPMLDKQVSTAKRLAKGQPAPDMDITTYDGKKMKLSGLKGKVVYLTFWASWCRQCVGEMINKERVTGLIRNKPLEFVYVSIDTDTLAARKIIERYKIDGIFTNVPGEWNARELQSYGVQSLPAYYLIDTDGKFALQNTPSPSQYKELILEIEKLFK